MERITISIETGNAAFEDSPTGEIGRILRDLAERFEQDGIPPEVLRDINGNTCGYVTIR
jgi:hypothetical protein